MWRRMREYPSGYFAASSNPRCRIESPASWATRRMRHARSARAKRVAGSEGRRARCAEAVAAGGAPALPARVDRAALRFRRRWSRPRAEAFEARRGVEPRSTILQTVLLPEQRAELVGGRGARSACAERRPT